MSAESIVAALIAIVVAALFGARRSRPPVLDMREARERARELERQARVAAQAKREAQLAKLEEERRKIASASDEELARMLDE